MTYFDTCKKHVLDSLDDYLGQTIEVCDFGMTITEGENATGSWYCSSCQAWEELKNWRDDIRDFMDEYEANMGMKPQWDAFTQPEQFHCLMMVIGVEKIINSLQTIQDNWNEQIEMNAGMIKQLKEEVEELTDFE